MNLYLDDSINKGRLADRLRRAGHLVIQPASAGLAGAMDSRHFLHAIEQVLVLLTRDHDDFFVLHRVVQAARGHHPGIVAVRADNDVRRDMKDSEIVRALQNLERAGVPIANEFNVLNHWR